MPIIPVWPFLPGGPGFPGIPGSPECPLSPFIPGSPWNRGEQLDMFRLKDPWLIVYWIVKKTLMDMYSHMSLFLFMFMSFSVLNCLSGNLDKLPGLNIISTSQNNISAKLNAAMKTERRILIWPWWMNELWSKNLHPCVLRVWLISSMLAVSWQVCTYYHTLSVNIHVMDVISHHLLYPPYLLSGHDHQLCLAFPTKHQKR